MVTQLMKELFKNIVDVKFTAKMESDLDDVERGEKNWVQSLEQFYDDFSQTLKTAEEKMEGKRVKIPDEETDEVCEVCGKRWSLKSDGSGGFWLVPVSRNARIPERLCRKCRAAVHFVAEKWY